MLVTINGESSPRLPVTLENLLTDCRPTKLLRYNRLPTAAIHRVAAAKRLENVGATSHENDRVDLPRKRRKWNHIDRGMIATAVPRASETRYIHYIETKDRGVSKRCLLWSEIAREKEGAPLNGSETQIN